MGKSLSSINLGSRSLTLKKGITVSFYAYLANLVFYIIYSVKLFYPIIITISIYLVFHGLFLYFLKKGLFVLVRNLFIILSVVFLVILTFFIAGPDTGVHYFLLIFSLLALSLANPDRLWVSIVYFSITLFLFAGAEFHFLPDHSVIDYPEKLAYIIRIQCVILGFVLIYYLSFLFFRINQQKEKQIVDQNEELQRVNERLKKSREQIHMQNIKMSELNDELQIHLEIVSRQNAELENTNASKDKFLSLIAHDLKNPLSAIIGISELLQNNFEILSREETETFLKGINESSNRINVLLMNLLNWAQSQRGNITPKKSVFSLEEILISNRKLFKQNLVEKEISLQVTIDSDVFIFADKDMIETVIRNLVSNAIKFTKEKGEILIYASRGDKNFILSVQDTGVGMDRATLQRIKGSNAIQSSYGTNNERGMGLGLQICKEFLQLNDFLLQVDSKPDKGSRFSIVFPLDSLRNGQ